MNHSHPFAEEKFSPFFKRTWKEAVLRVQFLVPVWFLSLIFVISKNPKKLAKLVESKFFKNFKIFPIAWSAPALSWALITPEHLL
jgi:hypothetical protein